MRAPLFQGIVGLVVAVTAILAGAIGDYHLVERLVLLVLGVLCAAAGASMVGEWVHERWLDAVEDEMEDAALQERLGTTWRQQREPCKHANTRSIDPQLCDGNTLRCLGCGHEFNRVADPMWRKA